MNKQFQSCSANFICSKFNQRKFPQNHGNMYLFIEISSKANFFYEKTRKLEDHIIQIRINSNCIVQLKRKKMQNTLAKTLLLKKQPDYQTCQYQGYHSNLRTKIWHKTTKSSLINTFWANITIQHTYVTYCLQLPCIISYQSISGQCSCSVIPANFKKPLVFWCFQDI